MGQGWCSRDGWLDTMFHGWTCSFPLLRFGFCACDGVIILFPDDELFRQRGALLLFL